jgi:tRNA modification GTPase
MLELILHGSTYLVGAVIDACVAAGARPARPGEFTHRAVANGKMDLVQAEAVRDLVAAETSWQARNARRQLKGELSAQVRAVREGLLALLAEVEAGLDFAEHGVELDPRRLEAARSRCREGLERLLRTAAVGGRIRDGLRVVILGPVNAGKSTLFNHLAGRDRAIVSPQPGTTRDLLETELEVAGVRVVLVDTAGIGDCADSVEREGVRRAQAAAATAGAAILLWPCGGGGPPEEPEGVAVIRVRSKADLDRDPVEAEWLQVSVHSGAGLDELARRLEALVAVDETELGDEVAISRRHRLGLERALGELEACRFEAPELAAEGLRWAVEELQEVIGEVGREAVLDEVFSGFCIGK